MNRNYLQYKKLNVRGALSISVWAEDTLFNVISENCWGKARVYLTQQREVIHDFILWWRMSVSGSSARIAPFPPALWALEICFTFPPWQPAMLTFSCICCCLRTLSCSSLPRHAVWLAALSHTVIPVKEDKEKPDGYYSVCGIFVQILSIGDIQRAWNKNLKTSGYNIQLSPVVTTLMPAAIMPVSPKWPQTQRYHFFSLHKQPF